MPQHEPSGVLLLDKPAGITSHDAVGLARRLFGTRRVGHTGTLDPMATGLLILLIGRAAKAAEYLSVHSKTYEATLCLGLTTDTEDTTGRVLSQSQTLPDSAAVLHTAAAFRGNLLQTPPMYSALKIGGKKLVDLARRGIEVERTARPIRIEKLEVFPTDDPALYRMTVSCSAGTYIRTLCADIGAALGCGGAMAALRRTRVGDFALADAHTPETLKELSPDELSGLLLPTETLFKEYPAVNLSLFFEKLARSGCEIYQKKIGTSFPIGQKVRLRDEKSAFFALGETRDFPDGSAVKPIKLFDIE